MISWVMVPNTFCVEWWGILSDEWWVTEIEWGVISDEKKIQTRPKFFMYLNSCSMDLGHDSVDCSLFKFSSDTNTVMTQIHGTCI